MSQLNLLQRAKQGEADAIAALMNLTLQERGVVTEVVRIQDYLHVSFRAAHPLNQATLVEFTRQGLARLQVETIQTVKVYGLQNGEELPLWVATFQIGELEPILETQPPERSSFWSRDLLKGLGDRWGNSWNTARTATRNFSQSVGPAMEARLTSWKERLKAVQSSQLNLPAAQDLLPPGVSLLGYGAIVTVVTVGAFVVGGMVAGLAISHGEKAASKGKGPATALNHSANPAVNSAESQEGRQYLDRMVAAQKVFYQKNQRLAQNLEELERSATIVSHSYNYTYRVVAATPTQFQLAAIARTPALKSYAAIVFLEPLEAGGTIATKLCETTQPSQVPPIVAPTAATTLQCSADSAPVP